MDTSERSWRWKNQYIDLIGSKPEWIIETTKGLPSPEGRALLQRRAAGYEQIVCEVGSGSGGHLIEQARLNPGTLHLGLELRFKRTFRTAEKAEQAGLSNLLLLRMNGAVLDQVFEPGSIDGVFVNFPDPWDKRRWHRNRLLNPEFLVMLATLLRPGGFFSYKTDHAAYFEETRALLTAVPRFRIEHITTDLHASELAAGNIMSEFELLFRSQSHPVCALLARRIEEL